MRVSNRVFWALVLITTSVIVAPHLESKPAPPNGDFATLRAHSLLIVDDEGRQRASLSVQGNSLPGGYVGLHLFAPNGAVATELDASSDESSLYLEDASSQNYPQGVNTGYPRIAMKQSRYGSWLKAWDEHGGEKMVASPEDISRTVTTTRKITN